MNENIYLKMFCETFHLEVLMFSLQLAQGVNSVDVNIDGNPEEMFHLSYHHITYCNQKQKKIGGLFKWEETWRIWRAHIYFLWFEQSFFLCTKCWVEILQNWHTFFCTHLNGFRLFKTTLESSWRLLLPTVFSQPSEITWYTLGWHKQSGLCSVMT